MATIAVVGGGLAGLACAWRLQRAGHAVRVLERGAVAGGRARSERRGDFVLDAGAAVVTRGQRRVLALAGELGMLGAPHPWDPARESHVLADRLAVGARALLALGREAGSDRAREALRAAFDLGRGRRVFDPAGDAGAELVRRGAAVDALGWWPDVPRDWDGPVLRALRGAHPLAAPRRFPGGVGALAQALAGRLDVVTDCEVRRVEADSRGVRLEVRASGRERSVRTDAVVLAVPATRVAALCPKLTPDERGFFEACRSEPATLVHLLFTRWPREALGDLPSEPGAFPELRSLVAEHERPGAAPPGGGVLRAALSADAAQRLHRASDASIADRVLESLAYSPGAPVGVLHPDGFAVWRHADAIPRFDRPHCRRLSRFARRLDRSPRIAFAGDALAGPSLDGAVASGLYAAQELARLL